MPRADCYFLLRLILFCLYFYKKNGFIYYLCNLEKCKFKKWSPFQQLIRMGRGSTGGFKSCISWMGRADRDWGSDLSKVTWWVQRVDSGLLDPNPELFPPPSRSGFLGYPCYEGTFPLDSRRTLIIMRLPGNACCKWPESGCYLCHWWG